MSNFMDARLVFDTDGDNLSTKMNNNTNGINSLTSQLADIATLQVNLESFKLQTPETDDTARINRAIDSISSTGGVIEFANKTYNVSGSLHVYNNVKLKGSSRGGTVINYSGSSYLITVTGVLNFYVQDMEFKGSNTGNMVQLNNVFKCSIQNVQFANCATAIQFANNAGDNTVFNCLFTDNAVALSVQSATNYVSNCVFSGNALTVQIGTQNVATFGGIRISQCTFATTATNAFPSYAIKDYGQTGITIIDKCWFEGFLTAIEVGDGTNGPYGFTVRDSRVSATSKCINLVAGTRFDMDNIVFVNDNSVNQPSPYTNAVPDELTIGSSAESGVIINPSSTITGRTFNPIMNGLKAGWIVLNNRTNPSSFYSGINMNGSTMQGMVIENSFSPSSNNVKGRVYVDRGANYLYFHDGTTYQAIMKLLANSTANRPTTNVVAGQTYFDSTLNKPIWRNAANNGWVDSTGATV